MHSGYCPQGDRSVKGVTYYEQTLLIPITGSEVRGNTYSRHHAKPSGRKAVRGKRNDGEINAIMAFLE